MYNEQRLQQWVEHLSQSELPVMKQTARDLTALHEDERRLTTRTLSEIICRDPIMVVKLLRHFHQRKSSSQTVEIIEVEQALRMLGVEPFYRDVAIHPLIEDLLGKSNPAALPPILRIIRRSQRAAEYAYDWAVRLHDLHFESVSHAALLHGSAEILAWCFAPKAMLKIREMQHNDSTLRSRDAQQQVLGFPLTVLQSALAKAWSVPELMMSMEDSAAENQLRMRNVVLAVNLARHSANGWDDAALPDDYRDIGQLLRMPPEHVPAMLKKT
ncbi:MAG: HDOD domain-containing protein [Gallionella sp.]|nr:HDOD domain-containing protein [Gallionella sp.]MDD4945852.1 HDOD domain-containing protein [Gallionella sp.]MDD5611865.1 HDOD domain-containing protein [Gallionella sp.]